MGLMELIPNKMTTMSETNSIRSSVTGQGPLRKKRTFDIAFLTGQDSASDSDRDLDVCPMTKRGTDLRGSSERESPYNLTQEGTNSDSSSIDVMTNGSFSESESPQRSNSPPSCGAVPPIRTKGKGRHNRGSIKEEIRFESKRTIDINQTSDSFKIKENLQFSTLLPSSAAASPMMSGPAISGDLSIPQIASTFAFLPQMTKFPASLPSAMTAAAAATHFSAKMEKCESINISYNPTTIMSAKIRVGSGSGSAGYSDTLSPYPIGTAGYPYPNLMLPQDLNHRISSAFPSGQSSVSPGNHGSNHCGVSPSATLLPPSLTALTLPAQNVCAKCNIGFRMTSDLVYHMRSHHKRDCDPLKKKREEKLKCPVCHETFRERHHLTRHMTAHQDREEELEQERKQALQSKSIA